MAAVLISAQQLRNEPLLPTTRELIVMMMVRELVSKELELVVWVKIVELSTKMLFLATLFLVRYLPE